MGPEVVNSLYLSQSVVRAGARTLVTLGRRIHGLGRGVSGRAHHASTWCKGAFHAAARAACRRLRRPALAALSIAILALVAAWEMRTSSLQAWALSALDKTLTYTVELGASPRIVFPREGPWDERCGYTRLAEFSRRLQRKGYRLVSQARFSPSLALAARSGVTPPQPEPSKAGLVIEGAGGDTLYDAVRGRGDFRSYSEIPLVVVQSLLFVENRELARNTGPTVNPAVDWSRFGKAALVYAGRLVGLRLPSEGGSTLAVQMEKYRHSPGGRTESGPEKLRQMLSASLRAYHGGRRTLEARRQIILAYVNSVPLGGAPGYGEVFGLAEGLRAWFGVEPGPVFRALRGSSDPSRRVRALRRVLALLCAVRAPSYYLAERNDALDLRVAAYTRLLAAAGILDPATAEAIRAVPPIPRWKPASAWENSVRIDPGTARVREDLRTLLAVHDLYDLDRLHVTVEATLEPALQRDVSAFFQGLARRDTVEERGLTGERLLGTSDPAPVVYSLLVCERTSDGDLVRVEDDNLPGPLDLNRGTMLELGSTAKLRTLVHYLDLVAREHAARAGCGAEELAAEAETARDPITRWITDTMSRDPSIPLDSLLAQALDREYSANPDETFFTGGGLASFRNFDSDDDDKRFTVREAVVRSCNLVFIRLMRDLVAYHAARLPYDAAGALSGEAGQDRARLLREIAQAEGESPDTSWLLRTDSRHAQDLRLRARIERDAFDRMAKDWRRLGFPFPRLVPSYATAIGSSADQPGALADLMAMLVNDGRPRPTRRIQRIVFAPGTPYETTYEAPPAPNEAPLVDPAVARAVRGVLADVVERGTARRVRGAFQDSSDAPVPIGGKTGTGDNRVKRFGPGGRVISSQAVNRTAAFVFYIEDRYYGVITASVLGPRAASYSFTSALPVSLLRELAPALEKGLDIGGISSPDTTRAAPAQPAKGDSAASDRAPDATAYRLSPTL